ncbi:hypothetical protein [Nocardia terpenica]|uniref:hypothetical protein n=1 Tax=Nocardia terpenica TaxID=455432 RepID=UPI0012FE6F76|nr:hypothetical protein [Nocardia terpenica]
MSSAIPLLTAVMGVAEVLLLASIAGVLLTGLPVILWIGAVAAAIGACVAVW